MSTALLGRGLGRARVVAIALLLPLVWLAGCGRKASPSVDPGPPIVGDDTAAKGLLLTYVSEAGEFVVVDTPENIPASARSVVRVIDPSREESAGNVYVADFGTKAPDGTHPTRTIARKEFEALALAKRPKPPTDNAGQVAASQPASKAVTVYGASWCGACQQTRAYLKRRNVPFVDKDIDSDSSAAREMQIKLSKAGLRGGSIPVIDVGGSVMVGFDPGKIDRALGG